MYITIFGVKLSTATLKICSHFTSIKKIPEQITHFVHLKILDLSYNPISEIPENIKFLVKLEELNLSNTNINKISPFISLLPNLSILNLDITETNDENLKIICTIKKLKILTITTQYITEIPDDIKQLIGIEEFYFRSKRLEKISNNLYCLSNLKKLCIIDSNMDKISDDVKNLGLEYLDLCGNNIENIDPLASNTRLINLYLSGNKIKYVAQCITGLINLEVLWIDGNDIIDFPTNFKIKELKIK